MQKRTGKRELFFLNTIWLGISFMWNSLHVLIIPAILLQYVPDSRKNTILGLLTFTGLIVAAVVQPAAGAASDRTRSRFGKRPPWIAAGTLLDVLFLAMMGAAGGLPLLALGYIGLQFTSNIAHGPAQGLMHDYVPPSQMGTASGLKNVFDMAGLILSSLLVGQLMSVENLQTTFLVIIAVLLASMAPTVLGIKENMEGTSKPENKDAMRVFQQLKELRSHASFQRLIGMRLMFLTGVYGIQVFAQYYIRDTLAVDDPVKLTGNLMASIVVSLILFSMLTGVLCDRFGRKPFHIAAAVLVGAGSIAMIFAGNAGQVLVFGSLIGAGTGLFLSANWALANDLSPSGKGGAFLGLTNLATAGAGALSRLFGPAIDSLNALNPGTNAGYTLLFAAAAFLTISSLILLTRIPETVMDKEKIKPAESTK